MSATSTPLITFGIPAYNRPALLAETLASIAEIDNPRAQHLAKIVPFYQAFHAMVGREGGIFIHDSTTITYLLAPQLFTTIECPVRVDCSEGIGRGKTWPATRGSDRQTAWSGRRPVTILTQVDADAAVELELSRLRRA